MLRAQSSILLLDIAYKCNTLINLFSNKDPIMKKICFAIGFASLASIQLSYAASYLMPAADRDPEGSDVHIAYENDTFTPNTEGNIHLPGAALSIPGDTYKFTLLREDKYAKDPNYEIVKAIAGVHIDDYDWSKASGDAKPEWGRILINGKVVKTTPTFPWDKRSSESSELLEMVSDAEVSKSPTNLLPSYIFDVTEQAKKAKWLTFEITNTREDGSTDIEGEAAYGSFVVNRVGYHVWYKKKS